MNCFECAKAQRHGCGRRHLPALRRRALPRPSDRGARLPRRRHALTRARTRSRASSRCAACRPGSPRRPATTPRRRRVTAVNRARRAEHDVAVLAKALGHPARIRILRLLLARDACYCGQIVEELPLAQATVSQHLKVLKDAGLVVGEIEGPRVCYCANRERLRQLERSSVSSSTAPRRTRRRWTPMAATETARRPTAARRASDG